MFEIGDRVKVISVGRDVSDEYIDRIGIVTEIKDDDYYKYNVSFDDLLLEDESTYLWWAEENLELISREDNDESSFKNCKCVRCGTKMEYLKDYRFDSQDNNRDVFAKLFDYEENLIFKLFVCPKCRHTEFFYIGKKEGFDDWIDWK